MAPASTAKPQVPKDIMDVFSAKEPGSMAQPVDSSTRKTSSESRIGRYHVELSLYSGGKEKKSRFLLSIEVPTLKAGLGICRVASAYISNIALRDRSSGG